MKRIVVIRVKAFLLLSIFTGNFLIVCNCQAAVALLSVSGRERAHCCCGKSDKPCRESSDCPGQRAVKFNLLEKKVAGPVHLSRVVAAVISREFDVPVVAGCPEQGNYPSIYFHQHAPPNRLVLYHYFLI